MTSGSHPACSAFTLIEAMVLLVIMSIVTVAAGVSLQGLSQSPKGNDFQLAVNNAIVSKMEEVRALDFTTGMVVGSTLSDTVAVNGTTYTRTVTIALADANGGGNDTDFKQITVAVNGQSLVTYVAQP